MRAAQAAAVHPSMIVVDKLLTNTPLILQKKLNRAGGTFPLHSAQLVATAMCVVAAVTSLLAPFATRGSRGCVLSLVQVPPH